MAIPTELIELGKKAGTQFNFLLPGGEILQAAINPGQAATIDLSKGTVGVGLTNDPTFNKALVDYAVSVGASPTISGGVLDRSTPQGSQIASSFEGQNVVDPAQALADALKATPVQPQGVPPPVQQGGALVPAGTVKPPSAPTQTQIDEQAVKLVSDLRLKGAQQEDINKTVESYYKSYGLSVPAGTISPQIPGITDVSTLYGSAEMTRLKDKIEDLSTKLAAGISTGGATEILTGMFEKFGIAKEQSLINEYNATILEQTQRLRKLPEDIKKTLEDVGVSESQLNRIVLKESQKPMEVLRDLMEQRGAAQDRINQSLTFVKLFADAAMQDRAAKLEAVKFELEMAMGFYKDLKQDQKDLLNIALDEKKAALSLVNDLAKNGAPQSVLNDAINLTQQEILAKYGSYLKEDDKNVQVIGSAETGYFQYDPVSKTWKPIAGTGGGDGTGLNLSDDAWMKVISAGQADISNISDKAQRNRVVTLLADTIPDPTNEKWVQDQYNQGKALGYSDDKLASDMRASGVPESLITKVIITPPKKTAIQKGEEFGTTLEYFPEAFVETVGKPFKAVQGFLEGLAK